MSGSDSRRLCLPQHRFCPCPVSLSLRPGSWWSSETVRGQITAPPLSNRAASCRGCPHLQAWDTGMGVLTHRAAVRITWTGTWKAHSETLKRLPCSLPPHPDYTLLKTSKSRDKRTFSAKSQKVDISSFVSHVFSHSHSALLDTEI